MTPIAGYDAGQYQFTTIDISDKISRSIGGEYRGGVLCPDGKIVFVPLNAKNIGIFDPSEESFTALNIWEQISIDTISDTFYLSLYAGGVLGRDGLVYFVPSKADNIGIFDPSEGKFTTHDISDHVSIDLKYTGGVLAPDGKIVFMPFEAENIGIFDPSERKFTTVENITIGAWEYSGGVLAPNGLIYFVPRNAKNTGIGIFDPSDRSFTTIDISDKISMIPTSVQYSGGVLGPDGLIYFVPYRDNIGIFDPSDGNFTAIDISDKLSHIGGGIFKEGVLGPNGKLVFTPDEKDIFGIFDPSDRSFHSTPAPGGSSGGGVLGSNGKIISLPFYSLDIGILDLGNQNLAYDVSGGIPEEWSALLSPHFNKS